MSPVASRFQISREEHLGGIHAPRPSMGAERAPRNFEITRCNPKDLPDPQLFPTEAAIFFLSHDPVNLNDDPIDGVGALTIDDDGEAVLTLEFSEATEDGSREVFARAARHDISEHFPVAGLTVTVAEHLATLPKIERIAA